MERERSVVWQKVMQTLWAEKTTQKDIARALDLPEGEVDTLIFGILHAGENEKPDRKKTLSLVS
jgi:DNA-directed RNA polymerase specialized sigma24 family protein